MQSPLRVEQEKDSKTLKNKKLLCMWIYIWRNINTGLFILQSLTLRYNKMDNSRSSKVTSGPHCIPYLKIMKMAYLLADDISKSKENKHASY